MWRVAIGRLTVRGAAQRRRSMRRRWGDRHGVQVACTENRHCHGTTTGRWRKPEIVGVGNIDFRYLWGTKTGWNDTT